MLAELPVADDVCLNCGEDVGYCLCPDEDDYVSFLDQDEDDFDEFDLDPEEEDQ